MLILPDKNAILKLAALFALDAFIVWLIVTYLIQSAIIAGILGIIIGVTLVKGVDFILAHWKISKSRGKVKEEPPGQYVEELIDNWPKLSQSMKKKVRSLFRDFLPGNPENSKLIAYKKLVNKLLEIKNQSREKNHLRH